MSGTFISDLLLSTVRMATPLLLCALGELFSERAGMINIGLDGIMTIGAFASFIITFLTGSLWLGLLAGLAAGVAMNMIYAVCTITLNSQQIINGMGLNLLAPALATYLYRSLFGISASLAQITTMPVIAIPVLSGVPLLGGSLFRHTPLVYIAFILVPLISIFFSRTNPGLNLRAVGEYPRAAETLGINAYLTKYFACAVCGGLAGVGGAYLTLCYIGSYSDGIVAGRGFIALSAVIFGRWSPLGILLATLLFGCADAMQMRLQMYLPDVSYQILAMLPYLLTMFALIFAARGNTGPKSVGKPYYREQR